MKAMSLVAVLAAVFANLPAQAQVGAEQSAHMRAVKMSIPRHRNVDNGAHRGGLVRMSAALNACLAAVENVEYNVRRIRRLERTIDLENKAMDGRSTPDEIRVRTLAPIEKRLAQARGMRSKYQADWAGQQASCQRTADQAYDLMARDPRFRDTYDTHRNQSLLVLEENG